MSILEWTQAFTNIAMPILTGVGMFFVWKQIKEFKKDMKFRFTYQKREKAAEMAKEFEKLLDSSVLIFSLVSKISITKKLHDLKINENRIKLFDFNEKEFEKLFKTKSDEISLYKMLNEITLKELCLLFQDYKNKEYYKEKAKYFAHNDFKPYSKEEIEMEKNEKDQYCMNVFNFELSFFEKEIRGDAVNLFVSNLNKLEYISMNFISNIADESLVYHSLHQVFLSYIEFCYFYISTKNNKGGKDKFYCNIIDLYKLWKKRYFEELENEENERKKMDKVNRSPISDFS